MVTYNQKRIREYFCERLLKKFERDYVDLMNRLVNALRNLDQSVYV